MVVATMTSKGQITVPKEIREALGLTPGAKVDFVRRPDGRIELTTRHLRALDLIGALRHDGPPISQEEMDTAIADGASRQ